MISFSCLLLLVGEKAGSSGTGLYCFTSKVIGFLIWLLGAPRTKCFKTWKMLTVRLLGLGLLILNAFVISSLPSFYTFVTAE